MAQSPDSTQKYSLLPIALDRLLGRFTRKNITETVDREESRFDFGWPHVSDHSYSYRSDLLSFRARALGVVTGLDYGPGMRLQTGSRYHNVLS